MVVNYSTRQFPGNQRSVGIIGAVAEKFKCNADSMPGANSLQILPPGSGHHKQNEPGINGGNDFSDGIPNFHILNRHIIKSAMRLNMLQGHSLCGGKGLQGSHLIGNIIFDFMQ